MRTGHRLGAVLLLLVFIAEAASVACCDDVSLGGRTYRVVGDTWFPVGDSNMYE